MGRVWKFGDNVDTDVITPSEYKHQGREVYVAHVMEPIEPDFADEVEEGDVLVVGKNFGSGSSRETAAIAFLDNEVEAIVAKSFSRIFFRNAINIGLPVYVCPEAYENIGEDDEVEIDHEEGVIDDRTTGESFEAEQHPEFIQDIIDAGGLAEYRRLIHEGKAEGLSQE